MKEVRLWAEALKALTSLCCKDVKPEHQYHLSSFPKQNLGVRNRTTGVAGCNKYLKMGHFCPANSD